MVEVTPKRGKISIRYWSYIRILAVLLVIALISFWRTFSTDFAAINPYAEQMRSRIGLGNSFKPETKHEDNLPSALRIHSVQKLEARKYALIFSATDDSGSPLSVIAAQDVTIKMGDVPEHRRDVKIDFVTPLHLLSDWKDPVSFANVMDYSGSMFPRDIQAIVSNYSGFINGIVMPFSASVIKFNASVHEVLQLTDNKATIETAIGEKVVLQTTALYSGIDKGIDSVQNRPNFRFLLLTTDGNDNSSKVSLDEVIRRARLHSTSIFVLGFGWLNLRVLQRLAAETDGYYVYVSDSEELKNWFPKLAGIVNNVQVAQIITDSDINSPPSVEMTVKTGNTVLTRSR